MPYKYEDLRPEFFTPRGNETLEKVRINVATQLMHGSQLTAHAAVNGLLGDNWLAHACLDRLVELGELVEVITPPQTWGQNRIFTRPSWHKNPRMEGGEDFFMRKLLFTGSADSMREMRTMMEAAQNGD